MAAFLLYIIKSTCCLTLFYLGYKALLGNETFFRFNRMVVLAGMLVCMLLPLVEIRTESPGVLQMPELRSYRLCGRSPVHGERGSFTCILREWRLSSAGWSVRL